ncbi:MAG: carbamoyltransferase HypF [Nitrospirota bacterium]
MNISVKGIVQGVGFRPFIYNLAREMSLKGFVTNTSEGVVIAVEGDRLELFIERIRKEAPPLSRIMSIDISPEKFCGYSEFTIKESKETGSFTLISPDISVCPDCLKEISDSRDRRYLYPFTNCTNCGPRYSITKCVPYDRINTTMNVFKMCGECEAEYHDPLDRRFHAQPNACPVCGPSFELKVIGSKFKVKENTDPIESAIKLLKQGSIVAVKGLGGFHIACDASNRDSVERLRRRKRRSNKPFALMAPDISTIRKFCHVSEEEGFFLNSSSRPIVLLNKRRDLSLSEAIAPNNRFLGFMLPYTPLHYILFNYPGAHRFDALVMTSGNLSEEPIVTDNEEAVAKLSGIADAFLLHNRDIFMRVDDSVITVRSKNEEPESEYNSHWSKDNLSRISFIRRSRGYVPDPITLKDDGPDVLGCGADLKNTFAITKGKYAVVSQHIGDMENYETLKFFEETLDNLKAVYRAKPEAIVHDLHPQYLSTQWALKQAGNGDGDVIKIYGIQHHYAHIASAVAEHGIRDKVIGISFDGNGYGEDGNLWGGEFLVADINGFKRAGHIKYTPLPGGETAIKEPWRISLSYLKEAAGDEIWDYIEPTGFLEKYGKDLIDRILKISANRQFSPLSSGAGRLFDAVSALMGICDKNTFEGEAAIALESIVLDGLDDDYPVDISFKEVMEIDFSHTVLKILEDMERRADRHIISTKFHNTVATAIAVVALKISLISNIKKAVLSGGVFQNSYLLNRVVHDLKTEGMMVYVNEKVPCNDAGISLGQAYIIRERIKSGIA